MARSVAISPGPGHWLATRIGMLGAAALLLAVAAAVPPLYAVAGALGLGVTALILRYPVAGFGLLPFSIAWGGGFAVTIGSFPLTSTEIIVASVGAAWLFAAAYEGRNPIVTPVWLPYLLVFLAAIALSVSQADDSRASLREIFKWVELTIVFLSAVWFVRSRWHVHLVVASIIAAGVSQAVLGYVQVLFALGPQAFALQRLVFRAYGTFDQPNPYAGFLNMAMPFALAMSLIGPSRAERAWSRVAVVLIGGAVLASGSRGAFLAAGVAIAVMLALVSRPIFRLVWTGILMALVFAWLAALGLVPLGPFARVLSFAGFDVTFGKVTDANFSAVERAAHWLAGVRMFAAHPLLGVGIGNYATAYPHYHPRGWYAALAHAHNYYINIAAEAGIVGLSAYLLLAGSALWYSYAAFCVASDRIFRAAALGVIGALVATDFHNLFDVLYVHGMAALLGLAVALAVAALSEGAEAPRNSGNLAKVRQTFL